jgi:CDP-2,3-bis-(O-geranylgeranyl)-sn-glycerol synthase
MDALLIFRLLFLLGVANGAPILAKKILKDRFARPLDGGALFFDGRPLFGSSKTARGVVSSVVATSICAPLVALSWKIGGLVAIGAMLGDLFSSFLKRRMARPPSSRVLCLDQIPESLFPLLACRSALSLSVVEIGVGVVAFLALGLLLSRILFALKLRDQPF